MTAPQGSFIPVSVVDDRLKEIEDKLATLDKARQPLLIERDALMALKSRALPGSQSRSVDVSFEASVDQRDGETLTAQLLRFVADRPGLKSAEIATDLVNGGFKSGKNPRKNVLTTLAFMVSKGRVRKDEQGRHYPVGEPRQLNLVANG